MNKIKKVFIICHTHTDIGYTDYQDTVLRQHLHFIDKAIEACEETENYPKDARFKWTCEVASVVEKYFQQSSNKQIERFLKLHKEGLISATAMAYHWTPLLSPEGMIRSLSPLMRLRNEYGLNITSAMQCDINGVGWLWTDILTAIGIKGLTMSINMHRGGRPKPDLSAFWWKSPCGNNLLTYNGPHYLYGIFKYGLDDISLADTLLNNTIEKLSKDVNYKYDFLYAPITHPARVDNGPPFRDVSDLIKKWNESERVPKIILITVDDFIQMLHDEYANDLPTFSGEWVDWWADGAASSAYETSLNRSTEALLPVLEFLASIGDNNDSSLIERAYENTALFDEHTWGAFSSVRQPYAPFTKAQWNCKAGFAYKGFALTHEMLSDKARSLAKKITKTSPEGEYWRRWGQYKKITSVEGEQNSHFLVINPHAWTRHIVYPIPPDLGGVAPNGILEAFLVDNYRDKALFASKEFEDLSLEVELPPFGYKVIVPCEKNKYKDTYIDSYVLENRWYKIKVDQYKGTLISWYDKELKKELISKEDSIGLGEYIYERVDSKDGRDTIFKLDFDRDDFGIRNKNTPFIRTMPYKVKLMPANISSEGIYIEIEKLADGAKFIKQRYLLPHNEKALYVDIVIEKELNYEPESIYIMFPFNIEKPTFHLESNGIPFEPGKEQLIGSCCDWYCLHRWVELSDNSASIVVVPIDAPLVHLGGIQTGRWQTTFGERHATIVSWPVQNHWDTNFKAGQDEQLLLRYRLTSLSSYNPAKANIFSEDMLIPPIIIRTPGADTNIFGQFLTVTPEGVANIHIKQAVDGRGLIIHAFNLTYVQQSVLVSFRLNINKVFKCTPIETDDEEIQIKGDEVQLNINPRSFTCFRVMFTKL